MPSNNNKNSDLRVFTQQNISTYKNSYEAVVIAGSKTSLEGFEKTIQVENQALDEGIIGLELRKLKFFVKIQLIKNNTGGI